LNSVEIDFLSIKVKLFAKYEFLSV